MIVWMLCILWLPLALTVHPAPAQQPAPLGAIAYAVVGNKFVVQGGAILTDALYQQFWALNLSSPWSITSPEWKQLPNGPYNAYHTAIASVDNKTFITFGRDTGAVSSMIAHHFVNTFNFTTNAWSGVNPATGIQDTSRRDFSAVLDPTAGVAHLVGGDYGVLGDQFSNMHNTYNLATKEMTESPIAPDGPRAPFTYGAAWLQNHQSMLLIGGQTGITYPSTAFRYQPSKNRWYNQTTTGNFAYNRVAPCVVSNPHGTKVVVYGGFVLGARGNLADPAVYVLDTTTWHWSKYPQKGRGRGSAACALVDNNLIVWGGFYTINHSDSSATPTTADSLLIMDITNGQWLTTYTPSPWLASWRDDDDDYATQQPSVNNDGESQQSGLPIAGLVGLAFGVAVVLFVLVVVCLRCWDSHRRKRRPLPPPVSSDFFEKWRPGRDDYQQQEEQRQQPQSSIYSRADGNGNGDGSPLEAQLSQRSRWSNQSRAPHQPLPPERPFEEYPQSLPIPHHQVEAMDEAFVGEPGHEAADWPGMASWRTYPTGPLVYPGTGALDLDLQQQPQQQQSPGQYLGRKSLAAMGMMGAVGPYTDMASLSPEHGYIKLPRPSQRSSSWRVEGLFSSRDPQLYTQDQAQMMVATSMPGPIPSAATKLANDTGGMDLFHRSSSGFLSSSSTIPTRSTTTATSRGWPSSSDNAMSRGLVLDRWSGSTLYHDSVGHRPHLYSQEMNQAVAKETVHEEMEEEGEGEQGPRRLNAPQGNGGHGALWG